MYAQLFKFKELFEIKVNTSLPVCNLDLPTVKLLLKYCIKKYQGDHSSTDANTTIFEQCHEWQKKHFQSNGMQINTNHTHTHI